MTAATCRLLLLLLLLGVHLAAAYTLAVGSASPRRLRTRPLSMNRVDSEGFNFVPPLAERGARHPDREREGVPRLGR